MTRFTDGRRTVEITMDVWQDGQYSPSFEKDFFDTGCLPYDMENDTYIVNDVDYLIDQAEDWRLGIGDYRDDMEGAPGHNPDDRCVLVEECRKESCYDNEGL